MIKLANIIERFVAPFGLVVFSLEELSPSVRPAKRVLYVFILGGKLIVNCVAIGD